MFKTGILIPTEGRINKLLNRIDTVGINAVVLGVRV